MTELSLVGDIGGTNSRFGLIEPGFMAVQHMETLRNDNFPSLEAAIQQYLHMRGVKNVSAAAIAVAAPVESEQVTLTNRDWSFSTESLRLAANAKRLRLLNDYEALALALPHLDGDDLVQIGGEVQSQPLTKIVLGPGTGLGMAALAHAKAGEWMVLPCEVGHITLPIETQEEFDWRERMRAPGQIFTTEDAISGGGLYQMYKALASGGQLKSPEAILSAALADTDRDARKTLDQFVIWLARIAGDAAMTLQARGGVYLAGGIAPSIVEVLKSSGFRQVFENKGKLAYVMRPIPIYVIIDRFPAFKGCAAALQQ